MSSNASDSFTKDQLFATIRSDGIDVNADIFIKAKNDDGIALYQISQKYHLRKNYSKALAWLRLAENRNNANALNSLGAMYFDGIEVPQDYFIGLEYFLKAAGIKNPFAMKNIAFKFKNGTAVPVDKYKALEWFYKSEIAPEQINELNGEGIFLNEEDKKKTLYQLIRETEDIIRVERKENILKENEQKFKQSQYQQIRQLKVSTENIIVVFQNALKEQQEKIRLLEQEKRQQISIINTLEQSKSSLEEQRNNNQKTIDSLKRVGKVALQERQKVIDEMQLMMKKHNNMEEQAKHKTEIMNSLKQENKAWSTTIETLRSLVDSKNSEVDSLKNYIQLLLEREAENQNHNYLKKEYKQLKRQKEKDLHQVNESISNKINLTTENDTELDNQNDYRNAVNDITIKIETETESENIDNNSYEIGNKRQKVTDSMVYHL